MSDGSSNAPEQSPDSPPSDSSETPPPPWSDSTTLSPPPSDSSPSTLVTSPPPPEEATAAEQPPPMVEAKPSPPPPSGGGDGSGNVGQAPPVPAAQVVGPESPGRGPREVPRLAPPRSYDNQTSWTNGNEVSTPESTSNNSHGNSNNTALIVGVVALGGVLLLLVIVCVFCGRKKKKQSSHGLPYGWEGPPEPHPQGNQYWQSSSQDHAVKIPPSSGGWGQHSDGGVAESDGLNSGGGNINTSLAPSPSLTLGYNKSSFSYEELAAATNNFDKSRMLGQGGFGYVYKGTLPNGKEIAVKSLKSGSGQGEREFQSEVEIISRVHHRHLVSLVGYCIAGGQRMLVYEFLPNDTLEFHLHKKDPPLDFSTRLRIALGSAKGLSYLHEDCHPRIIHRDIKASNILLDENFEAMVADFGLAKLTTDTNTHVSTRVMGTFGYLAPEYASSGKLTEKSDVFSYGVMLLELITGRPPVDPNMKYMEDSLVDWSRPLLAKALETGNYDELADPRLERIYNPQEMQRMVACAAASIRHSAKKRPKMSQIVRALEGDVSLDDLNEGTRGGQSTAFSSSEGGSEYDTRQYNADLKKFRQMAFETQDFASKEHGGNTNDYGLNQSSSSDNSREINDKLHRPF
ncbi:proline-rich receptor-like protein kinase PERK15 [Silene latifolia]|uniref:proline-rich receptor-like protein kinase PERK15 n=1 Tax=Silene latifolia TaxID=37657 RepID=UPI003D7809D6